MIPLFKVYMASEAPDAVGEVLRSGWVAQGPKVDALEAELEAVIGKPVASLNSGTSALQLALHLAGVRYGDPVISTPMTCTATTCAISNHTRSILWCDIDPETGLLDPDALWEKLRQSSMVKAVVCVDWGGVPCDYATITEICHHQNVRVIRDAAHAFPQYDDRVDFTCYSFQAVKHLTTGDGGALVCNDAADDERARRLRWFGLDRTMERDQRIVSEAGYKYHMNDIAATIGLANLPGALAHVSQNRRNALFYAEHLRDFFPGEYDPNASYWFCPLLVPDPTLFRSRMAERGVEVSQVHKRNDRMPAWRDGYDLGGTEAFEAHQIGIPSGWWLTEEDREHIVNAVKESA